MPTDPTSAPAYESDQGASGAVVPLRLGIWGGHDDIDWWSEESLVEVESSRPGRSAGRFHGPVPNQVLECRQRDADVATNVDEANSTLGDEPSREANGGAEKLGSLVDG